MLWDSRVNKEKVKVVIELIRDSSRNVDEWPEWETRNTYKRKRIDSSCAVIMQAIYVSEGIYRSHLSSRVKALKLLSYRGAQDANDLENFFFDIKQY